MASSGRRADTVSKVGIVATITWLSAKWSVK